MFDNPKPKDKLETTVGDWNRYGRQNFNKGIKACIESIKTNKDVHLSADQKQDITELLKRLELSE